MAASMLRIEAEWLFDGTGSPSRSAGAVLCRDGRIVEAGPSAQVSRPADAETLSFPGMTLMPGLIDSHVHITMPGDGTSVECCAQQGEHAALLRAAANCRRAVCTGTTTAAECGAPGLTAYSVKKAVNEGVIPGPRLFVCGRAMTMTGGHAWPFGGEADGVDGVRREVRRLAGEGADFIKVMASGGSTLHTRRDLASFSLEEMRAIVDAAHACGLRVVAHACNTASIVNSLEARVDVIAHCAFTSPEAAGRAWPEAEEANADFGTYRFQPELAARIAGEGIPVCPTMCTHRIRIRRMERKAGQQGLTPHEAQHLDYLRERYAERCDYVGRLRDLGVTLIAGSDAGWGPPFGSLADEIAALVDAGLPLARALHGATGACAGALGIASAVGRLVPGCLADLLLVEGRADTDAAALTRVRGVWVGGVPVYPCHM